VTTHSGLCGVYNGNQSDDFTNSNGQVVCSSTACQTEFIKSWRYATFSKLLIILNSFTKAFQAAEYALFMGMSFHVTPDTPQKLGFTASLSTLPAHICQCFQLLLWRSIWLVVVPIIHVLPVIHVLPLIHVISDSCRYTHTTLWIQWERDNNEIIKNPVYVSRSFRLHHVGAPSCNALWEVFHALYRLYTKELPRRTARLLENLINV